MPLQVFEDLMDLLEVVPRILSDNITTSREIAEWWHDHFYPAQQYTEFNAEILDRVREESERVRLWWSRGSVTTVHGVPEEMNDVCAMLRHKLEVLNHRQRGRSNGKDMRRKMFREQDEDDEDTPTNREVLEAITENYHQAQRKASRCVWSPQRITPFTILEDLVILVVQHTRSKVDFSHRYPDRMHGKQFRSAEEMHTEERLAAAALYTSLFAHEQTTIVTMDSDMQRILRNTTLALTLHPSCPKTIREHLIAVPVENYRIAEPNTYRTFSTTELLMGERAAPPEALPSVTAPQLQQLLEEKIYALQTATRMFAPSQISDVRVASS